AVVTILLLVHYLSLQSRRALRDLLSFPTRRSSDLKTAYLYSGQLYVIAGVNKSGRVCLFNRNDRDYIFRDFSPGHNRNRSVMAIAIYSVVVYLVGISTGRYIRAHTEAPPCHIGVSDAVPIHLRVIKPR